MALPTSLSGIAIQVSQPFISSGGNVYFIARDSTTASKLRAFKATDPTSSFSNVGTDVSVSGGNSIEGLAVVQDGDNLHVVTCGASIITDVDIYYHIFSMSSDSWTTSNETVKINYAIASSSIPRFISINIRSDGDVIVFYNGPLVANMGSDRGRVYYARREAAVWTVDIAVDNGGATDWMVGGIVRGSSDRMHLFFSDDGASDAYQRCLRSANTLETFPSAFDTTLTTNNDSMEEVGVSYDASGTQKVRFPYQRVINTDCSVSKCDSADTPTMTEDNDVTGTRNWGGGERALCLAADGTDLYLIFSDNTTSDTYFLKNANDGGWGSETLMRAGTWGTAINATIYTRSGDKVIALIASDAGTFKYDEYVILAGDTSLFVCTFDTQFSGNGRAWR